MRKFTIHNSQFTIFLIAILSSWCTCVFAQSNLTYDLKIGTTGEVALLNDFPDVYAGEKVNIRIQTANADGIQAFDSLDFVFADHAMPAQTTSTAAMRR